MKSFFSSDIEKLNSLYHRLQFSFVFLYGRSGTGKTALIRQFCQDKTTVFFSAQETIPQRQLAAFYRETVCCLPNREDPHPFENWSQAFSFLAGYSFSHRLVVVFDEFQILAQRDPDFMKAFEYAVHNIFPSGKIFLIVTSSSVDYARQLMESPIREPFGAITARAFLDSLPFYTCRPLLAGFPPREQLLLYGVTAGLPSRLRLLDPKQSAQQNIQNLFFRSDGPLFVSPLAYLHQELREITTYNYLLEIIAGGVSRLTDISAKADIGTNKCAKYLGVLISMGILRKEFPTAGDIQKRVRYVFADHTMRFWYRFVYPNISGILSGRGTERFERFVKPALDEYLLPVFEAVCAEYLERLAGSGQTPFTYRHAGSWWCGGTKREPFFRIPLVAMGEKHVVLGACHCEKKPAEASVLTDLLQPFETFGKLTRYCCIFSMSGFTDELRQLARKTGKVWLIDLEDITA